VQHLVPIAGEGSNIIVISSIRTRAVVGKPGFESPCLRLGGAQFDESRNGEGNDEDD
jgi:hypothetical protein